MDSEVGRVDAMTDIDFRIGSGRALPARLLSGSLDDDSAELTIEVGPEQWSTVDMNMLFHTEWGDRHDGEIEGAGDVRLALRLDSSLRDQLDPLVGAGGVTEAVAGVDFGHALRSTEAWYALIVTEAVPLPPALADKGELRSGFTTIWNDQQGQ